MIKDRISIFVFITAVITIEMVIRGPICVLKSAPQALWGARRGEAPARTPPTTEAPSCTRGGALGVWGGDSWRGAEASLLGLHVHRPGFGFRFWALDFRDLGFRFLNADNVSWPSQFSCLLTFSRFYKSWPHVSINHRPGFGLSFSYLLFFLDFLH